MKRMLVLVVAGLLLCCGVAGNAITYTVTNLGSGYAYAINRSGQVAGDGICPATSKNQAYLWQPDTANGRTGSRQWLGTAPGDTSSTAYGINDQGQVVGSSSHTSPQLSVQAYVWSPDSGMQGLGALPGYSKGYANAISNSGKVVGYCYENWYKGFEWTQSNGINEALPLPAPPGSTEGILQTNVTGVNSAGTAVGLSKYWVYDPDGYGSYQPVSRACLWSADGAVEYIRLPANPLDPHSESSATHITESGIVVGWVSGVFSNNYKLYCSAPFIWSRATGATLLPAYSKWSTTASSVNSSGQLVGSYYNDSMRTGFAWTYIDGVGYDMNALIAAGSGWKLLAAQDINDRG